VPDISSPDSSARTDTRVAVGATFAPKRLSTTLDRLTRPKSGKRSLTRTSRKRGRYIASRPSPGEREDVAFDATVRTAAPHQIRRQRDDVAIAISEDDLQRKVRVRRAANLILFVVDASWSMAAAERMQAAKGAVFSLLTDAYQRRDQVGLIVFHHSDARLVLPPTSSIDRAKRVLRDIPVGGKTPLSSGLFLAHQVLQRERQRNPEVKPLLILLTDAAANVSMTDLPPQEEALRMAGILHQAGVTSVVINTEHEAFDRGLAQSLAERLGGACYTLKELKAETVAETVRERIGAKRGNEAIK
jgi:magnesium chelatase subunit D